METVPREIVVVLFLFTTQEKFGQPTFLKLVPWLELTRKIDLVLRSDDTHTNVVNSTTEKRCYTAGFFCLVTSTVFYTQGGKCCYRNHQNVCWYSTRNELNFIPWKGSSCQCSAAKGHHLKFKHISLMCLPYEWNELYIRYLKRQFLLWWDHLNYKNILCDSNQNII